MCPHCAACQSIGISDDPEQLAKLAATVLEVRQVYVERLRQAREIDTRSIDNDAAVRGLWMVSALAARRGGLTTAAAVALKKASSGCGPLAVVAFVRRVLRHAARCRSADREISVIHVVLASDRNLVRQAGIAALSARRQTAAPLRVTFLTPAQDASSGLWDTVTRALAAERTECEVRPVQNRSPRIATGRASHAGNLLSTSPSAVCCRNVTNGSSISTATSS